MYFSASRNFWMQAPIEAIPVAPGSSRKVSEKLGLATLVFFDRGIFNTRGEFICTRGTDAGTNVFGRKKRCLGPQTGPARPYRQKDDRRIFGGLRGIFGGLRGIFGGPCYSEPGETCGCELR
jgi:hypothetical protein